jgi:uncharacterized membrane protein
MRSSGFGIVLAIMLLLFLMMMGGIGGMAMVRGGFMMSQMLFPFLIIAFIALIVRPRSGWHERRRAFDPPPPPTVVGTPEEVLRQRYARGELTRDQYQDAIMELLKSRYVTGEMTLEEYETRVGTLLGDSRQRRLQGEGPKDYV